MKNLPLLLLFLLSCNLYSQEKKDTLYFNNNSVKEVIVFKITDKNIFYKTEEASKIEYVTNKHKLQKIVFSDGQTNIYQKNGTILQKKMNIGMSLSYSSSATFPFLNLEYMYGNGLSAQIKVNPHVILAGSKYYFKPESNNRFKVSTGILLGFDGSGEHSGTVSINDGPNEDIGLFILKLPLDFTYQLKKGFNVNLGLSYNNGYSIKNRDYYTVKSNWAELELGLGYRF